MSLFNTSLYTLRWNVMLMLWLICQTLPNVVIVPVNHTRGDLFFLYVLSGIKSISIRLSCSLLRSSQVTTIVQSACNGFRSELTSEVLSLRFEPQEVVKRVTWSISFKSARNWLRHVLRSWFVGLCASA